MSHLRQQIREQVAATVTGLTTTGSRVFQSRVYPLESTDLPGLLVYSTSEVSQPVTMPTPRIMERQLRLQVTAVAKGTSDLDDTLDEICKEVEIALGTPGAITTAKSIMLVSTEIELTGTADQPIGQAAMTYQCTYFATENAPDVAY